jgi:phosphoribosyl-AMP cyclohydrolase
LQIITVRTFPGKMLRCVLYKEAGPATVRTKSVGENDVGSKEIEEGLGFQPKFDEDGLIPAIAQDAQTGQILMVAYMNRQALDETIASGCGTYFSRSRGRLWKKGEESGHVQKVEQILVDCDQDCLVLRVTVDAGQCHVGYKSCFYRALKQGGQELESVAQKVFDPNKTYKK